MIQPGDIFRTRNGTVLIATRLTAKDHGFDWWDAFALYDPARTEGVWHCESFWLEGQERLT